METNEEIAQKLNRWLRYREYGDFGKPDAIIAMVDNTITAPAQYDFSNNQIRINTGMTGTKPDALLGFLGHEMGHSVWSTWKFDLLKHHKATPVTKAEMDVITAFDEIRIERRAIDGGARNLRASFAQGLTLMLKEGLPSDRLGLSLLWVITYGRYLASIAAQDEVLAIHNVAKITFGEDTVDLMIDILSEAVAINTVERLHSLAQEWVALIMEGGEGEGEGEGSESCDDEDMEPGCSHGKPEKSDETEESKDKGDPAEGDGEEDIEKDPSAERTRKVETDYDSHPDHDEIDSVEEHPDEEARAGEYIDEELMAVLTETVKALAETVEASPAMLPEALDMENPVEAAKKVFGRKVPEGKINEVVPPREIVTLAHALARQFESIAMPTIAKTTHPSQQPPGRLRGREMVRMGADRAQGRMTAAEPWKHAKRRHTSAKPVVVGIMTDVSGSMGWAQNFVAEFTYIVSTAGIRIGARCAALTFGSSVTNTLKPGEVPSRLRVVQAVDGTEKFDEGMAALDGVLNLTFDDGKAKMLFIVSDGHFVRNGECNKAVVRLKKARAAGTTVVWLGNDATGRFRDVPGIIYIPTARAMSRGEAKTQLFRDMAQQIVRQMR